MDKFTYVAELVDELIALIQQRRHLKEKVDVKSAVHTLKKMLKEREAELAEGGTCNKTDSSCYTPDPQLVRNIKQASVEIVLHLR